MSAQLNTSTSNGLAIYASFDHLSKGRLLDEPGPGLRGEFQRDRDRVVHSAAFRRLEYKTQVFVNHEGDMFRTRLTHSIEVSQIARTVARVLHLNEDLTEAIALAHDLGHTPFGHAGQDALHACMREYGGFEHNLQSLRIVDVLEEKYAAFRGLNLSFETREGILKHCSKTNARTLGSIGRRFIDGGQSTLEAQLANVCDAIAYNNHDVDDGLRAGLLEIAQLHEITLFREAHDEVRAQWPNLHGRRIIHETIRRMIDRQVRDLITTTSQTLLSLAPTDVDTVRRQSTELVRFSDSMHQHHLELKRFLRENLYQHYRVHRMATKARRTISDLFQALMEDTRILPHEYRLRVRELEEETGRNGRARAVADYVAGMTDRFAIGEHRRIFDASALT
ncbi:MAG: dGTPase [Gammaproteobacteria bacterium]